MTRAHADNAARRADLQRRAAARAGHAAQRAVAVARQAKLARRYETLGRVPHASKDPGLISPDTGRFRPRFVKQAERIFGADSDLYAFIDEQVASVKKKAGRPAHLETRTVCMLLWLHVVVSKDFFILNSMTSVVDRLDWRTQRDLGIDCDRRGRATPLTYDKLLDAFHRIADAFDPYAEGLDDDERRRRETKRLELLRRLCRMSLIDAPTWNGNGAVDTTLKWAWERPPGAKSKTRLTEREGQPAVPLGEALAGLDPNDAFTDADILKLAAVSPAPARKKHRPSTWSRGSGWVGRDKAHKSVFGVGLSTLTCLDEDGPAVIRGFDVHHAAANPADIGYRIVEDLYNERVADPAVMADVEAGRTRLLGDITADPAYGMMPERWHLKLRHLDANCLYRLHKGNQAGSKWVTVGRGKTREDVLTEDGAPVCRCTPAALRNRQYPHYPSSRARIDAFAKETLRLDRWRWQSSSAWRPVMARDKKTGQMVQATTPEGRPLYEREFRAPHGTLNVDGQRGGCEHCVTASGAPAVDDAGREKVRCCTVASHIFEDGLLPALQEPYFATPDWFVKLHAHNRVEGSFGIAKNLAVLNWGRQYHRFVGVARESLVAAFVVMAYNFHLVRTWQYRQRLAEAAGPAPFDLEAAAGNGGAAGDTPSTPATVAKAPAGRARTRKAPVTGPPKQRRGPKGLPMLGDPPTAAE